MLMFADVCFFFLIRFRVVDVVLSIAGIIIIVVVSLMFLFCFVYCPKFLMHIFVAI